MWRVSSHLPAWLLNGEEMPCLLKDDYKAEMFTFLVAKIASFQWGGGIVHDNGTDDTRILKIMKCSACWDWVSFKSILQETAFPMQLWNVVLTGLVNFSWHVLLTMFQNKLVLKHGHYYYYYYYLSAPFHREETISLFLDLSHQAGDRIDIYKHLYKVLTFIKLNFFGRRLVLWVYFRAIKYDLFCNAYWLIPPSNDYWLLAAMLDNVKQTKKTT